MAFAQNTVPGLTSRQGQALVDLVRQTLALRLKRPIPEKESAALASRLQDAALHEHRGAFVTLKIGGGLRGCIGSLTGHAPLVDCVRTNAINAAFHDPRFRPLDNKELQRITIEVSILTPSRPLIYRDVEDLLSQLRPGVDGVTVRKNTASATFLPQVWDQLPEKEAFLEQLCRKAGLSADAWRDADLEVETYRVQCFEAPV